MIYVSPKFSVNQIVFQHDPAVDAVFRGRVIGIHVASMDANHFGGGNWSINYEVQFHPSMSSDMVAEKDLMESSVEYNWPELPAPEPEPIAVPAAAQDAAAHG